MFTVRGSHGRALYSPLSLINQRSPFSSPCRRPAVRSVGEALLQTHWPVAEQLAATEVWNPNRRNSRARLLLAGTAPPPPKKRSRKASSKPVGDKSRINIVSDKLCDDILSYIGPSLERHRGCDILDIYPGAGVWSTKLHQFLQARSHVLLEPDADLYRPFLQPLLDQPGTTLIPKSGIIWRELNSVLTPEYLPHQVIPDDLNVRNDTLLVTANISFHPKKSYLNFGSIASLLLHQFASAIRNGGLFQRYGLVRMLIWTRPDDKSSFLPRTLQKRRRQALENDLVCEWVREVCGNEAAVGGWYNRDDAMDDASLLATIKRMQAAELQMPPGREPDGFQEALAGGRRRIPGLHPPTFKRRYYDVLADLQAANAEQGGFEKDSDDFKAMSAYTWRATTDGRKTEKMLDLSRDLDNIIKLRKSKRATAKKIAAAELEWQTEVRDCPKTLATEFLTYKDSLHAFRRTPPLLLWDRRDYEPLTVQAEEFFPNIHCSLLDIQPRAPHPLLRQMGPGSNRSADTFDIVMGSLMSQSTQPLNLGLDALWPGAAEYILPRWKSGQDLSNGGFLPHLPGAEPIPRLLDARQWEELLELWMEWPFRPDFNELVGRAHDDLSDRDEEGSSSEI